MSALTITTMTPAEQDRLAAPDPEAGLGALHTGRGNLPLDQLDVRAHLTGLAGAVRLTQGFTNPYDEPLEATYIFPLPDRFAVTGMTMTAGDRTVEAALRERGAARAEYQRAVAEGRRSAIAEEERPDVFTMRVGNILPGERISIELSLAGPLSYEDGEATFRFPLVVAPRYIPGSPLPGRPVGDGYAFDTDAVPDASRITPPVLLPGFPNPVRLAIEVTVDAGGLPLGEVRCSLPTAAGEGGTIRVAPGQRVDRDFLLRLRYGEQAHATHGLLVSPDVDSVEGTFQLTVLPPAGTVAPRPRDVVLVLDRSGSMSGWKMVAARRAAARIIDTLTGADRFAVLTFDSVVERPSGLPAGLVTASDRHRYRAVEHLARAEARGGTELLGPLREALGLLAPPAEGGEDRDRVLVLVTDGQVGNEDQILRQTASAVERVRMHTVGIDQAVNAGFLGRLAALGGGRCELVESEDRLDEAMGHIHRRIGAPVVTGLSLQADGLDLLTGTIAPARLPDLFPGAPLVLTGRYRGDASGAALAVRGQDRDGGAWQARVEASTVESDAVRPTWARAYLRDLEDRYTTLRYGPGQDIEELERTIVATSLRFGVLCRFTAYVAVDSRVVTDGGTPHRVVQPVEAPAGWDMLGGGGPVAAAAGAPMTLAAVSTPMPPSYESAPTAAVGGAPAGVFRGGPALRQHLSQAKPATRATPAVQRAASALDQVADLAHLELRRLRAAEDASPYDRRQLLDDLASRLAALLWGLAGSDVSADALDPVRHLVEAIHAGRDTLDELWAHAVRVLERLGGAGTPPPRSNDQFWKR